MTARLGVDLGTTWTAAAVIADGRAAPVGLGGAGPAMPSVVAIVDGKPVAGEAAVRAGAADPTAVAREFKRRLGDTTPIVLAGTPYGAETLTGHLLAHVVGAAASKGAEVALAHPATWGEYKLDLLREAGRVAGLDRIHLVPEPVAAAGYYARLGRLATGDTVAVYDFGGGTFDAAVVRLGPDGPELLGHAEGLDRLGGVDLDQAVLAHVNTALDGALSAMDRDDLAVRRAALALRADCVAAKEALSADTDTTVTVSFPGLSTSVRLTRAEFEAAVRPRLAETLSALDRAIASAGVAVGDLAGVVLVGGSSRIPVVAEQVAAHTGRPLLADADPKLAVAFGAAEPHLRPAAPAAGVTKEAAMPATPPSPTATEPGRTPPVPPGSAGPASAGKGASGMPPRPSERRTAPGNAPKEQSGLSTAGKVVAGVAAAGAATAAGLLWHDDVTDALGFGDDPEGKAKKDKPADEAADAESMDAFDAAAGSSGGGGGGGYSGGGGIRYSGGGGGGGGGFAPPQSRPMPAPSAPEAPASPMGQPPTAPPLDPAFATARDQLRARLAEWQPPEGADAAEVAELRTRLGGLLDRYQPRPGQPTEDAIAELRDEFALRIDDFTQDERIEALIEAQKGQDGTMGMPPADPEFDAARQTLRDRLTEWQPPEGTDPERAAELKAELEAMIDRYRPLPGQSRDDAVAELQDRFEGKVEDFERDSKIDALIDAEKDRDGAETPAPPGSPTEPPGGAPMPPPPPTGAGQDPATGGPSMPPPPPPPSGAGNGAPIPPPPPPVVGVPLPVEDSPPPPTDPEPPEAPSDAAQGVAIGEMDPSAPADPDPEAEPEPDGSRPDPRITTTAEVLTDEFDEMAGAPAAETPIAPAPTDAGPQAESADVLGDEAVAAAVVDAAPAESPATSAEPEPVYASETSEPEIEVYAPEPELVSVASGDHGGLDSSDFGSDLDSVDTSSLDDRSSDDDTFDN